MTYHYRYFDDGVAEQWDCDSFPLALRRAVTDAFYETAHPVEIIDDHGNRVGRDAITGVADMFDGVALLAVSDQELLVELDRVRWRLS